MPGDMACLAQTNVMTELLIIASHQLVAKTQQQKLWGSFARKHRLLWHCGSVVHVQNEHVPEEMCHMRLLLAACRGHSLCVRDAEDKLLLVLVLFRPAIIIWRDVSVLNENAPACWRGEYHINEYFTVDNVPYEKRLVARSKKDNDGPRLSGVVSFL